MATFESNPFRGHTPADLSLLPSEVGRFLEDQHLALRSFASKVQFGATVLSEDLLSQHISSEIFPLGVTAQFLTENGLVSARLMKLSESLRAREGLQYVYATSSETAAATGESWEFAGIILPGESVGVSEYAWVIFRGVVGVDSAQPNGTSIEWNGTAWIKSLEFRHGYSLGNGKLLLKWPWMVVSYSDNFQSGFTELLDRIESLENLYNDAGIQEFKEYTESALLDIQNVLGGADFNRALSEYTRLNEYVASVLASIETSLEVASQQNTQGLGLLAAFGVIQSELVALVAAAEESVQSVTSLGAAVSYSESQARTAAEAAALSQYLASVEKDSAGIFAARAEAAIGLVASLGGNYLNPNYELQWDVGDSIPDDWSLHKAEGTSASARVINDFGKEVVKFIVTSDADEIGFYQPATTSGLSGITPGWYVLEAKVKLISGELTGAGIRLQTLSSGNVVQETFEIDCAGDESYLGVPGEGEPGRRYYYAKLIESTDVDVVKAALYALGNDDAFTPKSKVIWFEHVSIRAASAQEISSGVVASSLEASVTTNSAAIADIEGSAAFYEVVAAAGGGFPAVVRLSAGKEGSAVDVVSEKFSVYTSAGGGAISELARFEGGVATIYGTLRVNSIETPMIIANAVTNTAAIRSNHLTGFAANSFGVVIASLNFTKLDADSVLDISYTFRAIVQRSAIINLSVDVPGSSLGTSGQPGVGIIDTSCYLASAINGSIDEPMDQTITILDTFTRPGTGTFTIQLEMDLLDDAIDSAWSRLYVTERKK